MYSNEKVKDNSGTDPNTSREKVLLFVLLLAASIFVVLAWLESSNRVSPVDLWMTRFLQLPNHPWMAGFMTAVSWV